MLGSWTRYALAALALAVAGPAGAQPAPESPVARVTGLVEDPNLPRDIDPVFVPPWVVRPARTPPADPAPPPDPTPPPASALTDFRLSQTYLPRFGDRGFGNHDTDFAAQFALPGWEPLGKPLLLKAGFGAHAWDGPVAPAVGVPAAVYDFTLDFGWKPRPAEWLFLDLGVTPGLYTDLRAFPNDAFRLRGRGLAIVALSERFQFVGGVLYVNRNGPKVVPAGGLIWQPDEATRFQVVFPQPKIARRVAAWGDRGWWAYVAGEFGGGTWAYERPDGSPGSLDLNDYRVILGTELRRGDGWTLRAETGYVFGRELVPVTGPRLTPTDTGLMRLALIF